MITDKEVTFTSEELASAPDSVMSRSTEDFVKESIESVIQQRLAYAYRMLLEDLNELTEGEAEQLSKTLKKYPDMERASAMNAISQVASKKEAELRKSYQQLKHALLVHRNYLMEQCGIHFAHAEPVDGRGETWAV